MSMVATNPRRRLRAASSFPASAVAIAALLLLAFAGCDGDADGAADRAQDARTAPALLDATGAFACGAPASAIAALPRDAASVRQRVAPLLVDVEGVVIGNFQGGLRGFFLHSVPDADDGDPATPEGVFVEYERESPAPRVGQRLRLRGEWTASDDAARAALALRKVQQAQACGASPLPDPVVMDGPPTDWQRHAGMRVRIPGPLVITGNEQLLRHGELWLSFDGRLHTPTERVLPGGAVQTQLDRDARRTIVVDDGRSGDYPRRLWHLPVEPGADAPYRAGSRVSGIEGVLDQRFGTWRVQLTEAIEQVEQAPRPAPPGRADDTLRIASFNVLNYFNGDGKGGGFPTERGAGSRNDLRRQRDKLVAAMRELDADVYALMEIENDGYGSHAALSELATALSEAFAPLAQDDAMRAGDATGRATEADGQRPGTAPSDASGSGGGTGAGKGNDEGGRSASDDVSDPAFVFDDGSDPGAAATDAGRDAGGEAVGRAGRTDRGRRHTGDERSRAEPASDDVARRSYAVVDAGVPRLGSDAIAVGLIYRTDRVRPVGAPAALREAPFDVDSRVPLAQAFVSVAADARGRRADAQATAGAASAGIDAARATHDDGGGTGTGARQSEGPGHGATVTTEAAREGEGEPFVVVVNHFKSKGCRDATGSEADMGDGQSCYAGVRLASAEALREWLDDLPGDYPTSGAERALILGDLNAYSREDALRALTGHGFVDLVEQHGDNAHTYVFQGQAGRLDHALAGRAVAARVVDAGVWHINADELPEFDYDGDARSGRRLYAPDPFRSSDHDPVWIDLSR